MASKCTKNEKTLVQNMKNYCLSLSNMYLCYVHVVGVIKLLHIVILQRETIKSPNVRPACAE